MKKLINLICILLSIALLGCGCKETEIIEENGLTDVTEDYVEDLSVEADISAMDFGFSNRDLNSSQESIDTIVVFSGETAQISGSGADFSNRDLTITKEGNYNFSGNYKDGKIIIDAPDTAKIQIFFDNLSIENSSGNAVYVKNADKVFITLKDGTENLVSDGQGYTETDGDTNIDAAIFSKADLTINGKGALSVNGNNKHAVISKDDLVIVDATIYAVSKNVALGGKDCVKIDNANINVTAGSDGIRSDNTEDAERGYIYIKSGTLNVTSENDVLQAATVLKIDNVSLTAKAGGGSANASVKSDGSFNHGWGFGGQSTTTNTAESAKALKAGNSIMVIGGSFSIDSSDDAVHSNKEVEISGGDFDISSGDDGIHADDTLTISSGNIKINKSYEGIEATNIVIGGGDIKVTASDDGMNAAGGNDASAIGGRPGQNMFSHSTGSIKITGGNMSINASGDGIDSNGTLSVSGGVIFVNGPQNSGNGTLDYQSSAEITGGTFIGIGASGMAQSFTSAEQGCIFTTFNSQKASSTLSVTDASGKTLVSIKAEKAYNCVVVSSPEIQKGSTYNILVDGETVASAKLTTNLYGSSDNAIGGGMPGGMPGGRPGGMRP